MKLFIVVLCLLSERFLIHRFSLNRFYWFRKYSFKIRGLPIPMIAHPYFLLAILVLLPLLLLLILLLLLDNTLFGLLAFIINLVVFYYCLGPENPFYPVTIPVKSELDAEMAASRYLVNMNSQLFALIFWFILLGPTGVLGYRLISLCKDKSPETHPASEIILGYLDWLTVRITLLIYMLAGNFQSALEYYTKMFLVSWKNNMSLLSEGGLLAAKVPDQKDIYLLAQKLVEHAIIVYLVLIALFTLASWL